MTQVIQSGQMFAPLVVNGLQHEYALEVLEAFFAHAVNFRLVHVFGDALNVSNQIFIRRAAMLVHPFDDRNVQRVLVEQMRFEIVQLPLLFNRTFRHINAHRLLQHIVAHAVDRFAHCTGVAFIKQLVALGVNHATLIVRDVVVFEQLFADVEVMPLDLALC